MGWFSCFKLKQAASDWLISASQQPQNLIGGKNKQNVPSQIAYNQPTEFNPAGSPVAKFCAGSTVFYDHEEHSQLQSCHNLGTKYTDPPERTENKEATYPPLIQLRSHIYKWNYKFKCHEKTRGWDAASTGSRQVGTAKQQTKTNLWEGGCLQK